MFVTNWVQLLKNQWSCKVFGGKEGGTHGRRKGRQTHRKKVWHESNRQRTVNQTSLVMGLKESSPCILKKQNLMKIRMEINKTETRDGINKAQNRFLKCVLDKPTGRQTPAADRASPPAGPRSVRGDSHCGLLRDTKRTLPTASH